MESHNDTPNALTNQELLILRAENSGQTLGTGNFNFVDFRSRIIIRAEVRIMQNMVNFSGRKGTNYGNRA